MMEMSENTKFQNTAGSDILIAKSGFSNHAASNILDDLCFSKFGTFHGGVQTWKDTEFDVRRGTEEILGFYSKELSLPAASGTYRFLSLHTKYMPFYASEIRQLFFV